VGVAGGLVAAVASMAGSRVSRRVGARRALPLFAALNLLALVALAAATLGSLGDPALVLAAMLVALAMGASAGLVFGLMMDHARPGLAALDYGIQSSVFILGRTLVPLLAGMWLDWGGHAGMLLGLVAAACAVLALAWCLRGRIAPR
jgi:predicted MFS family arabinose efflux permease